MNARAQTGTRWTREELMLVISLYYQIPFGRQHSNAPEVIALAKRLGRTPGSIAMKLNNLTSLDPEEAKRGIRGLAGASNLDRSIWHEFHENWELMVTESQALWEGETVHGPVTNQSKPKPAKNISMPGANPAGPTEGERSVRVRLAQSFFRRVILASYDLKCCISGNPVPDLLIASHILPWSECEEHRLNPRNGLCLSRLHDAAFDRYLITLDEDYRLVISKTLKEYLPDESIRTNFLAFEGKRITLPGKNLPNPQFLSVHRDRFANQ